MPDDRVDLMFRAFSDSTRLRILHLLLDEEKCVGDIVRVLRMSQPKVSRHLAYLRRSNLVVARRQGLWIHYALAAPRTTFQKRLVACLESCFAGVPEIKADRVRAARLKRKGGCCAV